MDIQLQTYSSPCGELLLGSYKDRLCLCDWREGRRHPRNLARIQRYLKANLVEKPSGITLAARGQLDEYFARQRQVLDLPILLAGTDFQKKVWQQLQKIPYGKTVSYREEAALIGMPEAVRAVANANGANALSIIVPCHRVIGANGHPTGYGGGMEAKKFLLALEGGQPQTLFSNFQ